MTKNASTIHLKEDVLQKGGLKHLKFLDAIAELPYVDAIYLFGSRARGDHRERSDIDLAIRYSDEDAYHRRVVKAIVDEISDTFLGIDLVEYQDSKLSKEFRDRIDKEKVVLYERL